MSSSDRWGTGEKHYIPETRDEIRMIREKDLDIENKIHSQAPLEDPRDRQERESEGGENEDDENSYSNTSKSMGEDDSQMYDRDQDFSDTLHGGKYTSGADQHRYSGAASYGGIDTSRTDSHRYPEYNQESNRYPGNRNQSSQSSSSQKDPSYHTPYTGRRQETKEDDDNRFSNKTPNPRDASDYGKSLSKAFVVPGAPSQLTEQMRLDASKKVTLPDLKVETVRRWESQVKDYEKYHGPWNRQTIDPKVKDLINYRWMKD